MSDLVSVIFPVGPGADEAELALADLREQTWGELEIIVVLNGCPERVRESFFLIDDERVRLIDLGAEGNLLQALEVAIDASRGKW
ncbi:MAG: glycosyltransferase family 2 protein, partial [Verrucomicrobiales bacterium]